jgi:recombinational DNA repair ATPase RecF
VTFLRSIQVEGFRGVGPTAAIGVPPGPGLTLVVGRNGSGKSSFAEGLEILMTGSNWRWARRSKVWRDGWRNLHHPERAVVTGTFTVEGVSGDTVLTRTWAEDAAVDGGRLAIKRGGDGSADLESLGWSIALEMYRPFLSYNELGTMFEGPADLHDRLMSILGLDEFDVLAGEARDQRLELERSSKAVAADLERILVRLDESDDPRAASAAAALRRRTWDLDLVEALVAGSGLKDTATDLSVLRALASLTVPSTEDVLEVAEALREVVRRRVDLDATPAGRASDIADVLRGAMALHDRHREEDCPVCGTTGVLDQTWRQHATTRLEELERLATEASDLQRETMAVMSRVTRLLAAPSATLRRAVDVGLERDAAVLQVAWDAFTGAPTDDPVRMVDHLVSTIDPVRAAAEALAGAATAEIERREGAWRPLALELARWMPDARAAMGNAAEIKRLRHEERDLKTEQVRQKHDRFVPIADQAKTYWELLRHQSNVELSSIVLEGTGPSRHVEIGVNVDGVDGAALGVMSQGELHAIALSLFLPRATMPASPFRFIVIDDPVQSMDPARVDGLARVLERVAADRQVIVFTHDDRLPEAVRRMGIDATITEVTRREGSVVELRPSLDPVRRQIEDAMAIARTPEVPDATKQQVVPGYCRSAIEAACVQSVRRKRLGAGESHQDVETAIDGLSTVTTYLALALFGDAARGGDVAGRLGQWGDWARDAWGVANRGAHTGYRGSLEGLVGDTRRLCARIREL